MPTPIPELKKTIEERYENKILRAEDALGQLAVTVNREKLYSLMEDFAKTSFDFLMDITAVDYLLQNRTPRFEVVYHLFHTQTHDRIRVKVPVPEEDPAVASVYPLWKAANFLEREVWDMYGIEFEGHPDLRRILLYEEFVGFPLRKDYPIDRQQPLVPMRKVEVNPTY